MRSPRFRPSDTKAVSPARGIGAEFGIAARAGRAGQRRPVATALGEIVEQDAARIVALGDRKADLARAGAVAGDMIGDLRRS